jgi:2-dehydro-3-deoxygluconokinase
MRLSTPQFQRIEQSKNFEIYFGGSEANVAVALAQWHVGSKHVSQLPDNELGVAALQAVKQYGVDVSHIKTEGKRIGIYFYEHGNTWRSPKVVYDRYHSAFSYLKPETFNWEEILEGVNWFHWSGITPAISQTAAHACLEALKVAKQKNIIVSGDINYRRVLWQYGKVPSEVMPELISYTDWVIGGVSDFENCFNLKANREEPFEETCKKVQSTFNNVKYIAKTIRELSEGSVNHLTGVLWNGQKLYQSKLYHIAETVDRIGTGDAFMAGLVYGALHKKLDKEIIEFATSAAVLKHTIPGDVLCAKLQEIEDIATNNNIGKLLR